MCRHTHRDTCHLSELLSCYSGKDTLIKAIWEREGWLWLIVIEVAGREGMVAGGGGRLVTFYPHSGSTEWLGDGAWLYNNKLSYKIWMPHLLQWSLTPQRFPEPPQPNSTIIWEPSIQTYVPMGAVSHSNHSTTDDTKKHPRRIMLSHILAEKVLTTQLLLSMKSMLKHNGIIFANNSSAWLRGGI